MAETTGDDQHEQEVKAPAPYTGPLLVAADGDSKADIRTKVWEHLESNNIAIFPRPVKNRIPNFKGSAAACDQITGLEVFQSAQTIKINPDKPQEQARFRTLESDKTLLVPTPRLRKGLFNKITPADNRKSTLKFCSSSQGAKQNSTPLGLDSKVKVDLVIIGSVAVSKDGWRVGKGEGYADLEYGMMAAMGAVDENTIVVTAVHDSQVMDLPQEIFGAHDVTVDFICTPTRVITCSPQPKPRGIIWSLLGVEKYAQIPILHTLREQERSRGVDVTLRDAANEDEIEDAIAKAVQQEEEEAAERENAEPRRRNRRNRFRGRGRRSDGGPDREAHRDMNGGGSGAEGGEHADGEDSPSGDKRRYNNNYRRRRMRKKKKVPTATLR